ncbi:hypothetical protein NIBR502774_17790 (plasmid) [Rhizobium sp. NIBRBAC000502774]|nr:hypothetical protein NIBR502774_17790 [Rhizobium sp. NIBRBAC000502774]
MIWNLKKLEKERSDLIEVISSLQHPNRHANVDSETVKFHIAAHMTRLSALNEEISQFENKSDSDPEI